MQRRSLYAEYVKEREGYETLETGISFATYRVSGSEIYIRDIFVSRDFRDVDVGRRFIDDVVKIGKDSGC